MTNDKQVQELILKICKESWENIHSISENLIKYGIKVEKFNEKNCEFTVALDLFKITKESKAYKHCITTVVFKSDINNYAPTCALISNGKQVYIDEIFVYEKTLDNVFPTSDFIKTVFDMIGIKLTTDEYRNEEIKNKKEILEIIKELRLSKKYEHLIEMFDNLRDFDNIAEIYEVKRINLEKSFEKSIELFHENIKTKNDKISLSYFLKDKRQQMEYSTGLIKSILINKKFTINSIKAEPIIFSNIFNLVKTEDEEIIDDKFIFLRQNYIYHAKKVEKFLTHCEYFNPLLDKIDSFTKTVIDSYKI